MNQKELFKLAQDVGQLLLNKQLTLATAESCTGGWIAEAITSVPGSSQWFERGFVTYSNVAKQEMLGVTQKTLENYGAVSENVVQEMVLGALKNSHASIAVAVSGIAGPDGGSPDKPVGTVWFAWAKKERNHVVKTCSLMFTGDRDSIRYQAVIAALEGIQHGLYL